MVAIADHPVTVHHEVDRATALRVEEVIAHHAVIAHRAACRATAAEVVVMRRAAVAIPLVEAEVVTQVEAVEVVMRVAEAVTPVIVNQS